MSTESPENVAVSSAQQFKQRRLEKERGELLTLSSGLVVRVRRPEVSRLISKGLIPANLVQVFLNVQGKQTDNMKPEDLEKLLQFQRVVAEYSFVEPVVTESPDYSAGQISIDDIDESDLEDVWAYVNGGLTAVESFRTERNRVLS